VTPVSKRRCNNHHFTTHQTKTNPRVINNNNTTLLFNSLLCSVRAVLKCSLHFFKKRTASRFFFKTNTVVARAALAISSHTTDNKGFD
jgi:hypothetical protein